MDNKVYNFIPFPEKTQSRYINNSHLPSHGIVERDEYDLKVDKNKLSGKIKYSIKVKTPLIIDKNKNNKNQIIIFGSTIRGCVRSNAEILSMSDPKYLELNELADSSYKEVIENISKKLSNEKEIDYVESIFGYKELKGEYKSRVCFSHLISSEIDNALLVKEQILKNSKNKTKEEYKEDQDKEDQDKEDQDKEDQDKEDQDKEDQDKEDQDKEDQDKEDQDKEDQDKEDQDKEKQNKAEQSRIKEKSKEEQIKEAYFIDEKNSDNQTIRILRGAKFYYLKNISKELLEKITLATSETVEKVKNHEKYIIENGTFTGHIDFKNLEADELGLLLMALKPFEKANEYLGLKKSLGFGRVEISIEKVSLYKLQSIKKQIEDWQKYQDIRDKDKLNDINIEVDLKNIDEFKYKFEMKVNEFLNNTLNKSYKLFDSKNKRMNAFYFSKVKEVEKYLGVNYENSNETIHDLMKNEIKDLEELDKKLEELIKESKYSYENLEFRNSEEKIHATKSILIISEKENSNTFIEIEKILSDFKRKIDNKTLNNTRDIDLYDLVVFANIDGEKYEEDINLIMNNNNCGFVYYNDLGKRLRVNESKSFTFSNSLVTLENSVMNVAKYIDKMGY